MMGRLNDRFGPRLVVAIGGILIGAGYLLLSQMQATWQYYLIYSVIIGLGGGTMVAPQLSTVARWFKENRGTMSGIVMAGGGAGGFILPPVLNWLISIQDWRMTFIILGAVILIVITISSQFLRRDPSAMGLVPSGENETEEQKAEIIAAGLSIGQAIRSRQLWKIFLVFFCFGFCVITNVIHIAPHVTDLGISDVHAANMLSILSGSILVGCLVSGSISDKLGIKRTLVSSLCLILLALLWLPVATETWMLYLYVILMGLGHGGTGALHSPLVADVVGIKDHGFIFGLSHFFSTLGAAAGPYIAGLIFDKTGSYQIAFVILVSIIICGIILIYTIKPTRAQRQAVT
jgi:MFS family permease